MFARNLVRQNVVFGLLIALAFGCEFLGNQTDLLGSSFQRAVVTDPAILRLRRQRAKIYPFDISAVDLYQSSIQNLDSGVPVRIRISSAVPLKKDQTFYIAMEEEGGRNSGQSFSTVYRKSVVMNQGQTSVEVDLNWGIGYSIYGKLSVSVDGVFSSTSRLGCLQVFLVPREQYRSASISEQVGLRLGFFQDKPPVITELDLSSIVDEQWYRFRRNVNVNSTNPKFLGDSSNAPNLSSYSQFFSDQKGVSDNTTAEESNAKSFGLQIAGGRFDNLAFGRLAQLPRDWRLLMSFDAIVIPVKDFAVLARSYPTRLTAVRKWVSAGGRLIVSDVGKDWKPLPAIAGFIGSGNSKGFQPKNWDWKYFQRTKVVDLKSIQKEKVRSDDEESLDMSFSGTEDAAQSGYTIVDNNKESLGLKDRADVGDFRYGQAPPIDKQGRPVSVLFRGYGKGKILAVSKHERDWTSVDWAMVETASGSSEVVRTFGAGFRARTVPDGFAIQSAGSPPVFMFVFLIFLFSIIVGPVFYYTLNRYRRVQWLVFIIPVFSILVSATLLLYTLAKDGIGLKSKRISVTYLDQPSGVSVTQTVQTVFQGISPGTYKFDPDLLLAFSQPQTVAERLTYQDGGLFAVGGCISARSKHNVVTAKPASTTEKVDIQKDSQGKWTATNELGFDIRNFYTKIEGQLYWCNDLKNKSKATLEKVTDEQYQQLGLECQSVSRNCYSEDVSVATTSRAYLGGRGYSNGASIVGQPSSDPSGVKSSEWGMVGIHIGLLGDLQETRENIPTNRAKKYLLEIQEREYIAICDDSPFAVTLKKSTSYEYQMHVIHGKW